MFKSLLVVILGLAFAGSSGTLAFASSGLTPERQAQVAQFDTERVRPVIENLLRGVHPVPELAARLGRLAELARTKYGVRLEVALSLEYGSRSRTAFASNHVADGVVFVTFYVPAYLDLYEEYRSSDRDIALAILSNSIALALIHEMDHAAHGYSSSLSSTIEQKAQNEILAWSLTCEEVIRPLMEKGLPVTDNQRAFYDAWVQGGRTTFSRSWAEFIKWKYGYITDK